MITISAADITASGGILAALSDKSVEYVQSVVGSGLRPIDRRIVEGLERVIVHTEPHLDEYFADLLFRACLPRDKWACDIVEQSIFAANGDLGCKHLWPSAAVLGIGGTAGGGVQPLFLFDEHVSGQTKVAASCSEIVREKMFVATPDCVETLLREVNTIDEFGGGHPQNLNNLIKTLHEVRFFFGHHAEDASEIRDSLSPQWKRAIIEASLAALLYCLDQNIELRTDPTEKRAALTASLENYIQHSPHSAHPRFADSIQRLKSVFGDQGAVFRDAVLRDRRGPITDQAGEPIPQLLILSRICFASERCWGPEVRDVIATHFWEGELQKQLNFYTVGAEVGPLLGGRCPGPC
jgi:hypothetical protein